MAETSKSLVPARGNLIQRATLSARQWLSSRVTPAKDINPYDSLTIANGATTVASLLGSGSRAARARQAIYEKWSRMESDPIVSTAIGLLVSSALGGSETSGDIVFIEAKADSKKDAAKAKIAAEIAADLSPLLNKVAYQVTYTAAVFGDAFARIYCDRRGVIDIDPTELLRPPLVQPFERGSRTVGYGVYIGKRNFERMDVSQVARMKMPRTQWVPQHGVIEKAMRHAITEDDIENLPIMPSMAGGSLLYNAEEPFDNLTASLLGLVGQRWMDSIDEQVMTVNLEGSDKEQQKLFLQSVVSMFETSKRRAEESVKSGRPVMERIRHILPVFAEKQLATIGPANGGSTGRAANITIEDVLLHAKLLAGAIGVDLSMIGFADQLSGGLGEGGFFRVSAQAAERSRILRVAFEDFCNHVIDIHTMRRYGVVFEARDRPWDVQFYGSISALEAERQRTRADAMGAGAMLAQVIQQMKDMGATEEIMVAYLTKVMQVDEDEAKIYASIVKTPAPDAGGIPGM